MAVKILKGIHPSVSKKLADGTPFLASTPILVKAATVKTVVSAGDAKASDICTAAVAAACAANGVK